MVGKEDDLEADLPLMDLGAKGMEEELSCVVFDGGNPAPVEVGSLSQYLQGFIYLGWLFGISSRWWFLKYFVIFIPKLGEDEPFFDVHIFFKWVETTN